MNKPQPLFADSIPLLACVCAVVAWNTLMGYSILKRLVVGALVVLALVALGLYYLSRKSAWFRNRRTRLEKIRSIPLSLLIPDAHCVAMGEEIDLKERIFLPDSIRTRHVHIIGATGSGKTESVVLNFLAQDTVRGIGAIILDAKGDISFLEELERMVDPKRLKIFDLSSADSAIYDPLADGTALEASQRLFASLVWSEEYYRSKALSTLQKIFEKFRARNNRNPQLTDVSEILEDSGLYTTLVCSDDFPKNSALEEFKEISGLRDQVRSLVTGHLSKCSPDVDPMLLDSNLLCPEMLSTSVFKASCLPKWSRFSDAS